MMPNVQHHQRRENRADCVPDSPLLRAAAARSLRELRVVRGHEAAQSSVLLEMKPGAMDALTSFDADADELIEWLGASAPDNKLVTQLRIQSAIAASQHDDAESLLALGLLQRPDDPTLMLLRARNLFAQHRLDEAAREVDRVLDLRPHSSNAARLAGEIALAQRRHARAAAWFTQAIASQPDDRQLQLQRIDALLRARALKRAAAALDSLPFAAPLLRARLLRAQGRVRDAVELLHHAILASPAPQDADALRAEWIESLEQIGEPSIILDAARHTKITDRQATIAAALALLRLGRFRLATARLARLVRFDDHQIAAWQVLRVAADLAKCDRLRTLARNRLSSRSPVTSPAITARAWRNGIYAALLREQERDQPRSWTDRASLLQPMLKRSLAVLDTIAPEHPEGAAEHGDRAFRRALLMRAIHPSTSA